MHCHDLEKVIRIKASIKLNENFYNEHFPINLIGQDGPDLTPMKLSEILGDAKFAGLPINYTVGDERSGKVTDVAVAVEVAWRYAPDVLGEQLSHPFLQSLEIDINNQRIMTIKPSQPSALLYSELATVEVNYNHYLLNDLNSFNEVGYEHTEKNNIHNLQEKKKKWPIGRDEKMETKDDATPEASNRDSNRQNAISHFSKEIHEVVFAIDSSLGKIDSEELDKLIISRFDLYYLTKYSFYSGFQSDNDGPVSVSINLPVDFVLPKTCERSGRLVRLEAIFSEIISGSIQTVAGATEASPGSGISPSSVIGPLRSVPPRGKSGTLLDTTDDLECVNSVNHWLERLDLDYRIKRFKLKQKLEPEAAMDHSNDERKLLKEKQEDQIIIKLYDKRREIHLDFIDVGVGVSQLVPVVLAAVCEGQFGLVKIEQPELHVHPEVQVELSDLFIESAREQDAMVRNFLIETHSEHLLLRLLRRIQEATDNELPPGTVGLRAEDLSVIHVGSVRTKKRRKTRIMRLRVDQDGEFEDRWPKGFFDERYGELF